MIADGAAYRAILGAAAPYDFVDLIYSRPAGMWASASQYLHLPQPAGSVPAYADLATPNAVWLPWRNAVAAGMTLQVRTICATSTDGVNAVFFAIQPYAANVGGASATVGTQFAIVTSISNAILLDSGWTSLPSGLAVSDMIQLRGQWHQASSGSGAITQAAMGWRWILQP